MTNPMTTACDSELLDQYLEDELDADEQARVESHLLGCPRCRRYLTVMTDFSRRFRVRVQHVTDAVDFVELEKQVLLKALRPRHSRSGFFTFAAGLKYAIALAGTAGLVFFFVYTTDLVKPVPVPSAIINSFTGSVSTVMIFETSDTRQTILWYKEDKDTEGQDDAV